MKSDIVSKQYRVYHGNFEKFKDSPQGTFQNDEETQFLRFSRLLKQITPQADSFTIHDVGCGVCDLHRYLLSRGIEHEFSGTEIVQEMIDLSREKYPDIQLYNRDLLNEKTEDRYDFVVLSGVFNIPGSVERAQWELFVKSMVEKMFAMCTRGIAFNLLTAHSTYYAEELHYFSLAEMFDFCVRNLSRFVSLDHAYPLYEATITVLNKDYVHQQYPQQSLAKYFRN